MTLHRFIAAAGEGQIYEVSRDDARYALKIFHVGMEPRWDVNERWRSVPVPDVIHLVEDGMLAYPHLAYELCELAVGGTLAAALPIRDTIRLHGIVSQLKSGLHALHSAGIVHRDLKAENVLFRDAERVDVVLADLGIATRTQGGQAVTESIRGTRWFLAPEQLRGYRKTGYTHGTAVDYFQLGLLLLHIWTGKVPFSDFEDESDITTAKLLQQVPLPPDMPAEWQQLVRALLVVQPESRLDHAGVDRWLRGEALVVPEVPKSLQYPELFFRTDDAQDLVVRGPRELAALMRDHALAARLFLYGWPIDQSAWRLVNPSLCALLSDVVEREFPRNHVAGVQKAIHLMDPDLPLTLNTGQVLLTFDDIGAWLEGEQSDVSPQVADPGHVLWSFLTTRPDPQIRDEAKALSVACTSGAGFGALLLWLQQQEEPGLWLDRRLGRRFDSPDQLLEMPDAEQARYATLLSDPRSALSLWCAQCAPEMDDVVERWRTARRLDVRALPYAFGRGPLLRSGARITTPEELYSATLSSDFWTADANGDRQEVEHWWHAYRDDTLANSTLSAMGTSGVQAEVAEMNLWIVKEWQTTERSLTEVAGIVFGACQARGQMVPNDLVQRVAGKLRNSLLDAYPQGTATVQRLHWVATDAARWSSSAPEAWRLVWRLLAHDVDELVRGAWRQHATAPGELARLSTLRRATVESLDRIDTSNPVVRRFEEERARYDALLPRVIARVTQDRTDAVAKVRQSYEGRRRANAASARAAAVTPPKELTALPWIPAVAAMVVGAIGWIAWRRQGTTLGMGLLTLPLLVAAGAGFAARGWVGVVVAAVAAGALASSAPRLVPTLVGRLELTVAAALPAVLWWIAVRWRTSPAWQGYLSALAVPAPAEVVKEASDHEAQLLAHYDSQLDDRTIQLEYALVIAADVSKVTV